jgi:hypothetical protein
MTMENGRGKGVGNTFNTWAARMYPATQVASFGSGYLRALRQEMLCAASRIDDELKRRERQRR